MVELKGSRTEANLMTALLGESQANRRYLYFARCADLEGYAEVGALFRAVADSETDHAFGHFGYLEQAGDPVTGLPVGSTVENLRSSLAGEIHSADEVYPGLAKTARAEGFDEIAGWFETLARAERSHAERFSAALASTTGKAR